MPDVIKPTISEASVVKLAFISPIPHLHDFAFVGDFDLALIHLFEKNQGYFDYHKKQADEGKYIILDNGAFELGIPYPTDQLIDMAMKVGASEIIAPDVLKDRNKTVELTTAFVSTFLKTYPSLINRKIKVNAVVQGSNVTEWIECFKLFAKNPNIDVISIADDPDFAIPGAKTGSNPVQQRVENRLRLLRMIEEIAFEEHVRSFPDLDQEVIYRKLRFTGEMDPRQVFQKEFHLLGIEDGRELLEVPEWIRSCDSYSAFKNGIDGIRYAEFGLPDGKKGPTRVNMEQEYDRNFYPNIYWNIFMLRKFTMRDSMKKTWK